MSKSFKNVTALKELSLTMKNNEVFCLLGHNGAGKTTTINCLTGLHNPTFGEAFVFGHSIIPVMQAHSATHNTCQPGKGPQAAS